ncbi:hypothetical protein BDV95DRAFT_577433 [Massariosphaeria phaeospora]|uniref:Uncharacterized protein n=1 Tax=Massariosphaeria phaeospora TaxID=100035 RepID=A0A7C8M3U7_9PLEO|nr:hypothetical protein BDV95DRAFT_577433 [Massariosphaeria phaeospora]
MLPTSVLQIANERALMLTSIIEYGVASLHSVLRLFSIPHMRIGVLALALLSATYISPPCFSSPFLFSHLQCEPQNML